MLDSLLAAVFFAAFYSKVSRIQDFQLSIGSYRLLKEKYLAAAARGVLTTEILLFVTFASGTASYVKESMAIVILAWFTFALLWKRRRANDEAATCSCFGSNSWLNRYPLTRNLVLLALAAGKVFLIPALGQGASGSWLQLAINTLLICGYLLIADLRSSLQHNKRLRLRL
nr:MauE/DoxX family redox-associated membrane protein [Paenibacillus sp. ACRRX]